MEEDDDDDDDDLRKFDILLYPTSFEYSAL